MSLTDQVIMPGADYQAICDAVRAKNGETGLYPSGALAAAIGAIETGGSGPEQTITRVAPSPLSSTLSTYGLTVSQGYAVEDKAVFEGFAFHGEVTPEADANYLIVDLGIDVATVMAALANRHLYHITASRFVYSTLAMLPTAGIIHFAVDGRTASEIVYYPAAASRLGSFSSTAAEVQPYGPTQIIIYTTNGTAVFVAGVPYKVDIIACM